MSDLFPSITPEIAKRYLDAGRAQKNDVSELLKRPHKNMNAKKWDMAVNGESFSASLHEEDISDWIGPDEEEDEDEELPENA